jgi:hypothetical protein
VHYLVHPSAALSSSVSKLVLHASDLPIAAEVLTTCAERVPTDYLTVHLHLHTVFANNSCSLARSHIHSALSHLMSCCELQMTLHCSAQIGAGAAAGCRRGRRASAVGHRGLEPAGARLRRHHLPGRRDAACSHHRTQLQGRQQIRHRHASSNLGTASAALLQLQPVQTHSKQPCAVGVWLESELYYHGWRRNTRQCGSGCTPRSAWRRSSAGCWASFSAPSCQPTSSRAPASTTCTRRANLLGEVWCTRSS